MSGCAELYILDGGGPYALPYPGTRTVQHGLQTTGDVWRREESAAEEAWD